MRAVVVHDNGGPEVMRFEERSLPEPQAGEARVRFQASGVNYFDIRQRTGDFKVGLPIVLGTEGAGVVEALGPSTDTVRVGERVGWIMQQGSYATHAIVPADRPVPLPATVDSRLAAPVLMQRLTAPSLT